MDWDQIIDHEKQKDYFIKLNKFLKDEYKTKTIYPSQKNIFKAFDLSSFDNTKVIIIGQDPYHQPYQAQGLAFSTPSSIKNPPSMVNIIKEILDDIGDCKVLDGDLTPWAKQGVLLINTILTVEKDKPKSHHNKGWEIFTTNIIKILSQNKKDLVFILWGSNAISLSKHIDSTKHHIVSAPHPSPLSAYRGFFGSKCFSKTNKFLDSVSKKVIVW